MDRRVYGVRGKREKRLPCDYPSHRGGKSRTFLRVSNNIGEGGGWESFLPSFLGSSEKWAILGEDIQGNSQRAVDRKREMKISPSQKSLKPIHTALRRREMITSSLLGKNIRNKKVSLSSKVGMGETTSSKSDFRTGGKRVEKQTSRKKQNRGTSEKDWEHQCT